MADKKEVLRLMDLAYQARQNLCKMCCSYSGNVHMGGDMSMMEVLTTLFHHTMNVSPELQGDPERDRFILSKGHGAVCMYIVMALKGFFDYDEICSTYGEVGSKFGQHPCKTSDAGCFHWISWPWTSNWSRSGSICETERSEASRICYDG